MLSWKRLLIGTLPLVATYFYSPIQGLVLNHYATRWYLQQNVADHSVQIRIHNLSPSVSLPIAVNLEFPGSRILNFEYSDPWDGPRISSLRAAVHSVSLRQFDVSLKRPILLDEHFVSSSLEDIEDQLQDAFILLSVQTRKGSDPIEKVTLQNHLLWLVKCRNQLGAAHPCCMERAWEKWEYLLRGIQTEEAASWKQVSGVQLGFPDFHIAPENRMRYVFSIESGHSVAFFVQYGFDRLDGKVDLSTSDGKALKVRDERDLDRPLWMVFFLYPLIGPIYGAAIVVFALAALFWSIPVNFQKTSSVVNQALAKADQMDTAKEWEEVYGRIKFALKDRFDYYRSVLGKPHQQLSSEQLFDYVRSSLRLAYRGGAGRFKSNRQLETTINRSLLELAAR